MKSHVIDFTPEGMAQAMHNDKFDLSFLGRQSIERATEIVFDEDYQQWARSVHVRRCVLMAKSSYARRAADA